MGMPHPSNTWSWQKETCSSFQVQFGDFFPLRRFKRRLVGVCSILPRQVTVRTVFKQFARCLVVLASLCTPGGCHEHSLDTHYRGPFSIEGWVDRTWWARRRSTEGNARSAGVDQGNASYSVIILSPGVKPSSQFRHKERVRFFGPGSEGSGVVSVQYVDLPTRWPPGVGDSPFHVKHPAGVDKRVRMVFLRRELDSWPASQVRAT